MACRESETFSDVLFPGGDTYIVWIVLAYVHLVGTIAMVMVLEHIFGVIPWERKSACGYIHWTMPLIELKDATSRLYDYVIAGMFIHSATTEMLYLITLIIRRRCKCDRTLKDVGLWLCNWVPDRRIGSGCPIVRRSGNICARPWSWWIKGKWFSNPWVWLNRAHEAAGWFWCR